MSNIFTWIISGVAVCAISGLAFMWSQNTSLNVALTAATQEIETLRRARELSESVLNEQLKREHEVNAKRKDAQRQLDEAAGSDADDSEFLDILVRLLYDNHEDSGSPATAKSH